jgi:site-specific DNA-methyltransferase (adenine-specific)
MALHYEDGQITLHHGDCREVLASLPDCSVDSVVTDPPYELGFMGKAWDGSGIAYSVEMWAEVLRVLKPGGHLCAFGGTRTYHRMACAIEDAGFEIRDSLHWVYGSGFPKSLDVSKAIDKAAGAEREVIATQARQGRSAGILGTPVDIVRDITTAATDAAKQWEGWGTALKPAHEPIVLARRPLIGTVAANVLTHGTGALNIDGARVDMGDEYDPTKVQRQQHSSGAIEGAFGAASLIGKEIATYKPGGRWPANVIFDTEAGALLDEQSGVRTSGTGAIRKTAPGSFGLGGDGSLNVEYGDTGGASRFFTAIEWDDDTDLGIDVPFRYVPKPSKRERTCEGTVSGSHPTVKPLALMRWLVRLVTPPGGTVLEPFAGSGTTLMACVMEGFNGIGIELTDEYLPIIEGRVKWAHDNKPTQEQLPL